MRQDRRGGLARSGADLALLVLAGVAIWQLDSYRSPVSATGAAQLDPVLVAAPALLLLAGAVLALRLLPVVTSVGERLAARSRSLVSPLAAWEVGRRPARAAGAVLLLTLALAVGSFSQSFLSTWRTSQLDQADLATGTDVVLDRVPGAATAQAAIVADLPDVQAVQRGRQPRGRPGQAGAGRGREPAPVGQPARAGHHARGRAAPRPHLPHLERARRAAAHRRARRVDRPARDPDEPAPRRRQQDHQRPAGFAAAHAGARGLHEEPGPAHRARGRPVGHERRRRRRDSRRRGGPAPDRGRRAVARTGRGPRPVPRSQPGGHRADQRDGERPADGREGRRHPRGSRGAGVDRERTARRVREPGAARCRVRRRSAARDRSPRPGRLRVRPARLRGDDVPEPRPRPRPGHRHPARHHGRRRRRGARGRPGRRRRARGRSSARSPTCPRCPAARACWSTARPSDARPCSAPSRASCSTSGGSRFPTTRPRRWSSTSPRTISASAWPVSPWARR